MQPPLCEVWVILETFNQLLYKLFPHLYVLAPTEMMVKIRISLEMGVKLSLHSIPSLKIAQ